MKYCTCEESTILDPGELDDLDECPYCCRPLKDAPPSWLCHGVNEGVTEWKKAWFCAGVASGKQRMFARALGMPDPEGDEP